MTFNGVAEVDFGDGEEGATYLHIQYTFADIRILSSLRAVGWGRGGRVGLRKRGAQR